MEASPWAWVFFVPFILVASFTVLNLFLAIIVNSLQHLQHEEAEHAVEPAREIAPAEPAALSREIAALRGDIGGRRAELGRAPRPRGPHLAPRALGSSRHTGRPMPDTRTPPTGRERGW